MQHTSRQLVEKVHAYTCDRCGTKHEVDSSEGQEFLHFAATGGWSSIFEDGAPIAIDLCQHCLKETLGPWLRVGKSHF